MTAMNGPATAEGAPVVLFDGVCNLCNSSVNFLIDRDAAGRLRFASLQSEAARRLLGECGIEVPEGDPDSMLLVEGGRVYKESTAALRTARYLQWPYRWGYVFIVVPRPIRDVFYRLVARNRSRWFGREDSCRRPTPELRARLLPDPAESSS